MAAYSVEEIRQKYDAIAGRYDLLEGIPELLGLRRLRRRLLSRARGEVLEVAVGTGKNLPHYPPGCRVTGVDISPGMLAVARRRARALGREVELHVMEATRLAFPDRHFDTVVSTLSTCTFPDPVAALREMGRVCRAGGRVLLLEHGRSDRRWLGAWQDRTAEGHARALACHWNRRPDRLVAEAGLRVYRLQRHFFGIFYQIEAGPSEAGEGPG